MKYLIAESVSINPHLETSGEIAVRFVEEGHTVDFVYLGSDLPWVDCALPNWLEWIGCSLEKRVTQFKRILAGHGVRLGQSPHLPAEKMRACRQFAEAFSGGLKELKEYRYGAVPLGMGAASSLISWAGDSRFDVTVNRTVTRRALFAAAIVYERALAMIQESRPDVVVTFNGRFATCRAIVQAATTEGIPVLRHERGATFEKYELFSEPIHSFSYIRQRIRESWSAADPGERETIGESFFVRRRQGDGIGWYSFTDKQVPGEVPSRVSGKKRVVYFSSSDDEYAAISDTVEPGSWGDQLHAVQALIDACCRQPDLDLIVRIHPHIAKKSQAEKARWQNLSAPCIHVIPPGSAVDSYGLLDSADLVVTYGSTIGIEAAYWGKPSILLGPSTYAGFGVCAEPKDAEELHTLLSNVRTVHAPAKTDCLPYGYYYLTYGIPYRFYRPESLSAGTFEGNRLNWDVPPIRLLRNLGIGKIYNRIMQSLR